MGTNLVLREEKLRAATPSVAAPAEEFSRSISKRWEAPIEAEIAALSPQKVRQQPLVPINTQIGKMCIPDEHPRNQENVNNKKKRRKREEESHLC